MGYLGHSEGYLGLGAAPPAGGGAALGAVLTGRNGPGRARTVANRAGTALTGAVRTGR